MRIKRLYVKDYGNLKNFEICPEARQQTTVILGRNGAGKSNLIEVFVEIFRDLEAKTASRFCYELNYSIRGFDIQIGNDPDGRPKQQITVNGQQIPFKAFTQQLDDYLPKYVFSYYSGWNRRLEAFFDKPTKKLYNDWKKGGTFENIPLRRLFYCRKDYSQLVLLAFFLMDKNPEIKSFLLDFLKIKDFESALFVMHRPFWRGSGKPTQDDLN